MKITPPIAVESRRSAALRALRRSRLGRALQFIAMAGLILQPMPATSYWTDSNNDGIPEEVADPPEGDSWWSEDSDGDYLTNAEEAAFLSDPYRLDSDFDGLTDKDERDLTPPVLFGGLAHTDPWDWDSDDDGYSDHDEYFYTLQGRNPDVHYPSLAGGAFYSCYDADGDGLHNQDDPQPVTMDRDGDGILNWQDSYMDDYYNGNPPPTDPWFYADNDNDGTINGNDPYPDDPWNGQPHYYWNGSEHPGTWSDQDGDGIPDDFDPSPVPGYTYNGIFYSGDWSDRDNDGVPDPADPSPDGTYWYNGHEYPGPWEDGDNDGIPNPADPIDSTNSHWYNGTEYAGPFTDTDGDSIPDSADSWPADPENGYDADGDGLDNYTETQNTQTNPNDVDSDDDYLTDGEEALVTHTNPNDPTTGASQTQLDFFVFSGPDTDSDGLPDLVERHYASDPSASDAATWLPPSGDLDGDGVTNMQAYWFGWDLLAYLNQYDMDGDGMTDAQEDYWNSLHPGIMDKAVFADAVNDPDGDGVFNFEEVMLERDPGLRNSAVSPDWIMVIQKVPDGSGGWVVDQMWLEEPDDFVDFASSVGGSPWIELLYNNAAPWLSQRIVRGCDVADRSLIPGDFDGDGMSDIWEHRHSIGLRDPSDFSADLDTDGLTNQQEHDAGTHPKIADSDGDGFGDGTEFRTKTNPSDKSTSPLTRIEPSIGLLSALVSSAESLFDSGGATFDELQLKLEQAYGVANRLRLEILDAIDGTTTTEMEAALRARIDQLDDILEPVVDKWPAIQLSHEQKWVHYVRSGDGGTLEWRGPDGEGGVDHSSDWRARLSGMSWPASFGEFLPEPRSIHGVTLPNMHSSVAAWNGSFSAQDSSGVWVSETRVALRATKNLVEPFSRTYLVIRRNTQLQSPWESDDTTLGSITLTIPAGEKVSNAMQFEDQPLAMNRQSRLILLPIQIATNHARDDSFDFRDSRPNALVDQGAYDDMTGSFREKGAIVWANLDHDEERLSAQGAVPDTIRFWHDGRSFQASDEDFQIKTGEHSIADQLAGHDVDRAAAGPASACPDIAPIRLDLPKITKLSEHQRVLLRVARAADLRAFHLYKRIPDFSRGALEETAIWGAFMNSGAPWDGDRHVVDDRTIDITQWVNENALDYLGHGETRRYPDDPVVFGIEAMLYKGMRYDFGPGSHGPIFDGNLDFTLLVVDERDLDNEIEIERFRLTCLRLPAFPGAQGFGKWSQGGRGGDVYRVSNRNPSGIGSLRQGLSGRPLVKRPDGSDSGRLVPRTIVFAVGGEIDLSDTSATAEAGSVTIAGQTAPGTGIALRNGPLRLGKGSASGGGPAPAILYRRATDYIVRYMRVRRAQQGVPDGAVPPSNADACSVVAATRVILDHCSFSWGLDGSLDVGPIEGGFDVQPEMDLTAQWCFINQTLQHHSKGALWRGQYGARYSMLSCFLSNNDERNPAFGHVGDAVPQDPKGCLMEAVNNFIFNWGSNTAGYMNGESDYLRLQFLNNYYKPGPSNPGSDFAFRMLTQPTVHFNGNEWNGIVWLTWHGGRIRDADLAIPQGAAFRSDAYSPISASDLTGQVRLHGGASRERDTIDQKFINDAMGSGAGGNSSGGVVHRVPDSLWEITLPAAYGPADTDGDGMPDPWEDRYLAPDGHRWLYDLVSWQDDDGDGWTNLEEYLNGTNPRLGDDPMKEQSSAIPSGDLWRR